MNKKIVPTIFTICAFITLITLGTWQVQRLKWKLNLISEVEIKTSLPPSPLPEYTKDLEKLQYSKIALQGHFLNDKEIHLFTGQKVFKGDSGYDILTPMQLSDGRFVLVDRGWIPSDIKSAEKRPETIINGDIKLTGMFHKGEEKGRFIPENDVKNNLWFTIKMDEISAVTGLPLGSFYIRALENPSDTKYPIPGDEKIEYRNDHLQYAITWYSLAIILLVIYFLYMRKLKKS